MKTLKLALTTLVICASALAVPATVLAACRPYITVINYRGERQLCYLSGEDSQYCYYAC